MWTSERLGHAAATNIGIRRVEAPVVILLDTSLEPTGDFVTPLVRALDDEPVAVAGGWGITSTDLRTFEDAPAGEVDAIEGYVQAFRRSDAAAFGPLDERFRFYRNLDIWWSLVLRDGAETTTSPDARSASTGCRSSGTSTAAGRASPTRNVIGSRSATSTGSSTASARGGTSWSRTATRSHDVTSRPRPS